MSKSLVNMPGDTHWLPFAALFLGGSLILWTGFLNSGTIFSLRGPWETGSRASRYISAFNVTPGANNGNFLGSERFYPGGWSINGTSESLCSHTTEVKLDQHAQHMVNFAWGRRKHAGGDEYYVFAGLEDDPEAVALVNDAGSGVYRLHWVSLRPDGYVPLPFNTRVSVILQYSCGRGSIDHSSSEWAKPEDLFLRWEFNRSLESMSHLEETRVPGPLYINDFRSLLGVGDSLLEQFMLPGKWSRVRGAVMRKIQASLIPETVYAYMEEIRRLAEMPRPALLLLNGGVWNVLRLAVADPMFQQYAAGVNQLLQTVQKEFPDVTIAWVGMTAMHIHRAKCPTSVKQYACWKRISYLSSSRARLVADVVQNVVAKHPDVHHIPMYNRTFVSAHCARPGDGRHYREDCNARWWEQVWGRNASLMDSFGDTTTPTVTANS